MSEMENSKKCMILLKKFNKGSSLMKKSKKEREIGRVFVVRETITETTTTEYLVEAKDYKEALDKYKSEGQFNGTWSGGDEDGVKVVNP